MAGKRRARRVGRGAATGILVLLLLALGAMPVFALTGGPWATYDQPSGWTEARNGYWPSESWGAEYLDGGSTFLAVRTSGDETFADGSGWIEWSASILATELDTSCTDCPTGLIGHAPFADFAARAVTQDDFEDPPDPSLHYNTTISDATYTTIAGLEAYLMTDSTTVSTDGGTRDGRIDGRSYWIPTDTGGIEVSGYVSVICYADDLASCGDWQEAFDQVSAECTQALGTLAFTSGSDASGTPSWTGLRPGVRIDPHDPLVGDGR